MFSATLSSSFTSSSSNSSDIASHATSPTPIISGPGSNTGGLQSDMPSVPHHSTSAEMFVGSSSSSSSSTSLIPSANSSASGSSSLNPTILALSSSRTSSLIILRDTKLEEFNRWVDQFSRSAVTISKLRVAIYKDIMQDGTLAKKIIEILLNIAKIKFEVGVRYRDKTQEVEGDIAFYNQALSRINSSIQTITNSSSSSSSSSFSGINEKTLESIKLNEAYQEYGKLITVINYIINCRFIAKERQRAYLFAEWLGGRWDGVPEFDTEAWVGYLRNSNNPLDTALSRKGQILCDIVMNWEELDDGCLDNHDKEISGIARHIRYARTQRNRLDPPDRIILSEMNAEMQACKQQLSSLDEKMRKLNALQCLATANVINDAMRVRTPGLDEPLPPGISELIAGYAIAEAIFV